MRIIIVSQSTYSLCDIEYPVVGREYELIPAEDGTDRQNRCFHSLLQIYWASGAHSYTAKNMPHFKKLIKHYLGSGKERYYELYDDNGNLLDEPRIRWRTKSWGNYSKKERMNCINNLISEMIQVGINDKQFHEILDQLEQNSIQAAR